MTGDLIDSNKIDIEVATDFIKNINNIAPIYFISGNHESNISIVVLFSSNIPLVYLGKNPWFGATIPPINGILICPPCACPTKIKSNSFSA